MCSTMYIVHKRDFQIGIFSIFSTCIFIYICQIFQVSYREALRKTTPCYKERYEFSRTRMSEINKTARNPKCITQYENKDLGSVFDPENFIGLECPHVNVRFSDVIIPRVALASFPGSGNTWLRHLIEHVSGIATGSIYCGVVKDIFIGECRKSNSGTIVIKTHLLPRRHQYTYDKVVLLVRNPFDAIVAEYNRILVGKLAVAPRQAFQSERWARFVKRKSLKWRNHIIRWLTHFNGSKHVIFHERLKTNLYQELTTLSTFLGIDPTVMDIKCSVEDQEGSYHRIKPDWFNRSLLYSEELNYTVRSRISKLYSFMERFNVSSDIQQSFFELYGDQHYFNALIGPFIREQKNVEQIKMTNIDETLQAAAIK